MFVRNSRKNMEKKRAAAKMIQAAWKAYKVQQMLKTVPPTVAEQMQLRSKARLEKAVAK